MALPLTRRSCPLFLAVIACPAPRLATSDGHHGGHQAAGVELGILIRPQVLEAVSGWTRRLTDGS